MTTAYTEGRDIEAQLTTARLLLAMFEEQLAEYGRMGARQRGSTERGRDLTRRLPGLKQGRATWLKRSDDLAAQLAAGASGEQANTGG